MLLASTPFLLLQDTIFLLQIGNIWNNSGVYFISLGLLNKKYNIMSKKDVNTICNKK